MYSRILKQICDENKAELHQDDITPVTKFKLFDQLSEYDLLYPYSSLLKKLHAKIDYQKKVKEKPYHRHKLRTCSVVSTNNTRSFDDRIISSSSNSYTNQIVKIIQENIDSPSFKLDSIHDKIETLEEPLYKFGDQQSSRDSNEFFACKKLLEIIKDHKLSEDASDADSQLRPDAKKLCNPSTVYGPNHSLINEIMIYQDILSSIHGADEKFLSVKALFDSFLLTGHQIQE